LKTIASEVLQHAREVPLQATTRNELAAIRQQLDIGEAASLERHGLAAYLVAGPQLERKLNTGLHEPGDDACPEGVALVHTAVDWARCGRTDPITNDTLRRLWPSYLPPGGFGTAGSPPVVRMGHAAGFLLAFPHRLSQDGFSFQPRKVDQPWSSD